MAIYIKTLTNKARTDTIYPNTISTAVKMYDGFSTVEEEIQDLWANKIDKSLTKQLSTEDYTTAEKNKLAGIPATAEENQNAFSYVLHSGGNLLSANTKKATLVVEAGPNITLAANPTTNILTISATGQIGVTADSTSIDDIGNYYTGTNVEAALQEVGYSLSHISSAASGVTLEDVGGYYPVHNVEDALQRVGESLGTKAPLAYPTFSGNILLDSSNQYAEIKVISTHASAFSMLKLQDVDNTGYDLTYDKVNGSFAINKTVNGAYSSSPLILTPSIFNYNNNTVWHAGNDGSGSGLDADTLDGNHASVFAKLASPTFTGTVSGITATMVGLGNVTNESKTTMFTSPNFTGTPTVSSNTIWHAGNDGTGSGLDADLVDGLQPIDLKVAAIKSTDNRNVNDAPQDKNSGFYADFKANSVDGLTGGGGTYHGVLTYRPYGTTSDFSGGPSIQLGFGNDGSLWSRYSASATTWNGWYSIPKMNVGTTDATTSTCPVGFIYGKY